MKKLFRLLFSVSSPAPAKGVDEIIAGFLGRGETFSGRSRLYHDPSIYGDDACELLAEIRQQFGTDFNGFIFSRYFPSETDGMFSSLARIFGYKRPAWAPFTVRHLRAVASVGRWFDPQA